MQVLGFGRASLARAHQLGWWLQYPLPAAEWFSWLVGVRRGWAPCEHTVPRRDVVIIELYSELILSKRGFLAASTLARLAS